MLVFISVQAQKLDSITVAPKKQYDYYWERRNSRNTTGWILLGAGVASIGIGVLTAAQQPSDIEYQSWGPYILLGGGFGATLTSIPFFISASSNKQKARLSLKGERASLSTNAKQSLYYTAATVTIKL